MALATKFAAMVSLNRRLDKKYIDIGDFINIVLKNASAIDTAKLKRLGEKVYKGGSAEIEKLLKDIQAGRPLKI